MSGESEQDTMQSSPSTWLFTLRLTRTAVGEGAAGWNGKIQSIGTGETRYFRDWDTLIVHLRAMAENAMLTPPREGGKLEE